MGWDNAVKLGFANYVNFSGRASRSEYWYWFLFVAAFGAIIGPPAPRMRTIFFLATFLPGLSVSVRRLHDLDRSGWWVLLYLIPIVGWIILIIWFCTSGTDGPNRFGANRLARLGAN